jgi:6-pyruvoyltetrahydropterin/6-carboxytetrahydropterin synthase
LLNKIIRKGSFDAGHRVMFQRFKCAHLHGHRYDYELQFGFNEMQDLGYAIDFSEIKRIAGSWIESELDHCFIVNPLDLGVIKLSEELKSNIFKMHLLDEKGSCNPTVENIAKEVFFAVQNLLENENLKLEQVTLHETANCIGICSGLSANEQKIFKSHSGYLESLLAYKKNLGYLEYDSRKVDSK